jgi:hypothetical protein
MSMINGIDIYIAWCFLFAWTGATTGVEWEEPLGLCVAGQGIVRFYDYLRQYRYDTEVYLPYLQERLL